MMVNFYETRKQEPGEAKAAEAVYSSRDPPSQSSLEDLPPAQASPRAGASAESPDLCLVTSCASKPERVDQCVKVIAVAA